MFATDLMNHPTAVVSAETLAGEARVLAATSGVETLLVVDAEGGLVGVLTGSDRLSEGYSLRGEGSTVADVMTSPAISLGGGATVGELAQVMLAHQLRVLPIVEEGRLIGVVDRDDLLRTLVHDDEVITSRVWSLLRDYAGLRRWGVHVVAGIVTVSGAFVDRADRTVVLALVRTVPGVGSVRLRMEHPIATGSSTG
ncbi:MAG TPA: CBS domain-containing protein [Pseudonocardiaceae bacterium]